MTYPSFEAYDPTKSEDDLKVVLVDGEETQDEIHDAFEMERQIAEQLERDVEPSTEEGDPSRGIIT